MNTSGMSAWTQKILRKSGCITVYASGVNKQNKTKQGYVVFVMMFCDYRSLKALIGHSNISLYITRVFLQLTGQFCGLTS